MPMSMRVTENRGNKMYLFFPLIEMPMIVIKNKVNKGLLATSMPFKLTLKWINGLHLKWIRSRLIVLLGFTSYN